MAERKKLLVLRLEGVLQSWGESSKWDFRDSGTMPTKSGIVGLLGCAMGLERSSDTLVDLARSITVAVRADRPGVKFVDFQTVQGNPLMAATGKPKTTGNTILSPHAYLQDACFTVFIDTTPEWRERITAALQEPRWCLYLGRKNCVPSRPVLADMAEYADLAEALKKYPAAGRTRSWLMSVKHLSLVLPVWFARMIWWERIGSLTCAGYGEELWNGRRYRMYLIKIEMARRNGRHLLEDCQQMHRFVTGLFGTDRQASQILYRINPLRDKLCIYLYAQAPVEQVPEYCDVQQRDITSWLEGMEEGQLWSFDLIAAPTKKVGAEGKKNSQRRILRSPAERQAWLERKAEQSGFALLHAQELEQLHISGSHRQDSGGMMYHDAYHYRGALQIKDAAAFRRAMESGIGSGRAYGFGMLMVKHI